MNDFTKEDLQEYISMRRNAIEEIVKIGPIPGILDTIEIEKMKNILDEFDFMEKWFSE